MYIELKNINKSFGDFQASKDVNFAIEKGKLVGLLGPSGSGKTTILRMLAGLEHQDSGDICINGNVVNDLPSSQRGIGFVFQNYALFPYLTVYDNIAYGLKIQKKDKKFIKQRVTELLDLVGFRGWKRDIRISSPVVRDSESHLQEHWHRIRKYCFWMNRLQQLRRKFDGTSYLVKRDDR